MKLCFATNRSPLYPSRFSSFPEAAWAVASPHDRLAQPHPARGRRRAGGHRGVGRHRESLGRGGVHGGLLHPARDARLLRDRQRRGALGLGQDCRSAWTRAASRSPCESAAILPGRIPPGRAGGPAPPGRQPPAPGGDPPPFHRRHGEPPPARRRPRRLHPGRRPHPERSSLLEPPAPPGGNGGILGGLRNLFPGTGNGPSSPESADNPLLSCLRALGCSFQGNWGASRRLWPAW